MILLLEGEVVQLAATGFSHTLVSSHIQTLATSKFKTYFANWIATAFSTGRMYVLFIQHIRYPLWKGFFFPFLPVSFQVPWEKPSLSPRLVPIFPTTLILFKYGYCLRTPMFCTLHSTSFRWRNVVNLWLHRWFPELFSVQSPTFESWWDSKKGFLVNEGLF